MLMSGFFNQTNAHSLLQNSASNNSSEVTNYFNDPWKSKPRNKHVKNTKRGPGKHSH